MKVAVLGNTGMLGGMLEWYLQQNGIDVDGFSRKSNPPLEVFAGWDDISRIFLDMDANLKYDYVINCIGAIKPVFASKVCIKDAIFTNAVFPRELADFFEITNVGAVRKTKLITITTDCVFSGRGGQYTENSLHDALDDYGKSKSLGEPENCMVIRTSIIGPEWNGNKRSLVEWLVSQNNKDVNGFTNHLWNGVTTLELSIILHQIMEKNLYENGTFHIFSDDIKKSDLLRLMISKWGLKINVKDVEAKESCNRTMRTVKALQDKVKPSSQERMIEMLTPFIVDAKGSVQVS